jgi:adenine-specific DNA-methyltransferase
MTNFEKLQKLLEELFQLDQADLDFGIYRIMNQKRDEVVRFLEKDLLPQVKEAFSQYKSADKSHVQKELDKLTQQIESAGMNPDDSPKVKELKAQMVDSSVDVTALENEVFSHLFNFFRRYYHEGDFISLRRYKEGVYAIPYEGEEVKLHWANHDQYYVKSSEYFRDYIFTMPSGKRVRVHLVAASSEQDNKKEAPGKERRFIICAEDPIYEENGELFIRFEYKPDDGKKKQDALNQEAIERVLNAKGFEEWTRELSKPAPTKSNPKRTVLEKHLTQYTARNTFDYFIHKDLGGFLRRELDFYIKNEVMHLDDIEHDTVPRVEQYLSKIKVIRKLAHKVIQFLEQLENFQKKLWLKKKFVVETNYCITLDRVPEELYPEIAANDAQREEWVRLFAIDKIERDQNQPGYSMPLTVSFLKSQPSLMIDTALFSNHFKQNLLATLDNIDDKIDGVVINAENQQALFLLERRYCQSVDCVYIDPPYNTDASAILYKNDYKDASWMSLLYDRLCSAKTLMSHSGILCMAIDDEEVTKARFLLESVFAKQIGIAVVRANPQSRKTKGYFSPVHEYALFFGKSPDSAPGSLDATDKKKDRYPFSDSHGRYAWMNFIRTGSNDKRSDRPKLFYPIFVSEDDSVRIPKMEWSPEKNEYELQEQPKKGEAIVLPVVERNGTRTEKNWHRGHLRVIESPEEYRVRRTSDGNISIDFKTRMDEAATPSTWWDDKEYASANYGAAELKELFGNKPFDFPKAQRLVADCLKASGAGENSPIVLDFFAGSGTTGHAVIELNRQDESKRKYILVDAGRHCFDVIVPRLKKAAYTDQWKDGVPTSRNGISHAVKVILLESYEDALNNLEVKQTDQQALLLEQDDDLRESYVLSYLLDVESRGSQSLLNIESFRHPDQYKLRVERKGETRLVNVDLVETFNWLLGLAVRQIDVIRGVRVVEGTNPNGDRTLILWRNLDEISNDALDEWFKKQDYNTKDQEYDLIYVNGDNNLENLRRGDQTWKVRLIEETFAQLMFSVTDTK